LAKFLSDSVTNMNTADVGTLNYRSPEMASRSNYDESTDIFSTGLMLYECYFVKPYNDYSRIFNEFREQTEQRLFSVALSLGDPALRQQLNDSESQVLMVEKLLKLKKDERMSAADALEVFKSSGINWSVLVYNLQNQSC